MLSILLFLVVVLLARWVVSGWSAPAGLPGATEAEVARLRAEVDELSATVRRLHEEQSFMLRLMSPGDQRALEEHRANAPAGALAPENTPTGETGDR